jgi:hypothetical protein
MPRGTLAGQLAALGFADTGRAQRLLFEELGLDAEGADGPLIRTWPWPAWPGWRPARRCVPPCMTICTCATG